MAQRMKRRSTRRRSPTTRRSRITRRARKSAKSGFSLGKKIFPIAKNLASPVAFIEQISSKHRQTLGTAYTNAPIGQKLKILTNIVTGSTTGLNLFKDEFQAPLSQLKISNIFNKWTTAGAAMIGYGIIAFRDPNGIRPLIYGKKNNNQLTYARQGHLEYDDGKYLISAIDAWVTDLDYALP